jgi:flagellar export protein FliJ
MSNTFRLGVVLRLRELAEDAARGRLGLALGHQRAATETLIALVARERDAQDRLVELQAQGAPAGDMVAVQHGQELAEEATREGQRALAAATATVIEARSALVEASSRRQVVERLRDRLRAAETREAQRREDALLSELAGVRHVRTMTAIEADL